MTALMIQGTGSDVGKSLFVAGLCRLLANHGLKVRPFKPQNMSNNAAVTSDGGEIGRAQALQARACRVPLTVHMNPVLLKPQSDIGSQVIVQGRMIGNAKAREFQSWKPRLAAAVAESFAKLQAEADIVIVEGAGSAAEVNLRAGDIANMGFARAHNVPVVLLADIDRGGVIAQVVGSKAVIDEADAQMIRGFVVNKFRGDPALFAAGMDLMAEKTGWPALGLVPYFHDAARLPAEDAQGLTQGHAFVVRGPLARPPHHEGERGESLHPEERGAAEPRRAKAPLEPRRLPRLITIAVPILPHISNFDDLDPLLHEPDVRLLMLKRGQPIPAETDLVILPGSKATIADLAALRAEGWDIDILAHHRRGGHVMGICGGFQMLGRVIADPQGIEGAPTTVAGLGLLDVETVMTADKTLVEVSGTHVGGAALAGYEMHVGETTGPDRIRPFSILSTGAADGAISANGRVSGTYLHGIFTSDTYRADLLGLFGGQSTGGHDAETDRVLDALADHIAAHVDLARMFDGVISWPPVPLSKPTGAMPSG